MGERPGLRPKRQEQQKQPMYRQEVEAQRPALVPVFTVCRPKATQGGAGYVCGEFQIWDQRVCTLLQGTPVHTWASESQVTFTNRISSAPGRTASSSPVYHENTQGLRDYATCLRTKSLQVAEARLKRTLVWPIASKLPLLHSLRASLSSETERRVVDRGNLQWTNRKRRNPAQFRPYLYLGKGLDSP